MPSNHYKGGEELDANLHSLSIEMDDIPQATVSADDYLKTNQVGGDDLDIDIPQGDDDVSHMMLYTLREFIVLGIYYLLV